MMQRIVCPWCCRWRADGPIVIDGRIHCRECGKRFFLAVDGTTTWPQSHLEKQRQFELKAEVLGRYAMPLINPTPWFWLMAVLTWPFRYLRKLWTGDDQNAPESNR